MLVGLLLCLAGCKLSSEPSKDLAQVHLYDLSKIDYEDKKHLEFAYIDSDTSASFDRISAKARYRGGASSVYPKHSFSVKLSEPHSLAGLPKDKDWILNASYIDKSFCRHTVSYDLFRAFSPNNIAPQHAPIEVFQNERYYGLFLLMERLDATRLKVDKKDSGACVFKDPPVFRDHEFMNTYPYLDTTNLYHQKFPKQKRHDFNGEMEALRRFIFDSSDEAFADPNSGIAARFDLNNIIDWHLLLLVTNNGDGIAKNFYLYRTRSGAPFRIAPWDYDATFGRDGDSGPHWEGVLQPELHVFFQRLLALNPQGYKDRLKARFLELEAQNILTVDAVNRRLLERWEMLHPYLAKNVEKWPFVDKYYADDWDASKEIPRIQEWVTVHLPEVSQKISEL